MPLEYADKYDVAAEASDSILGSVKNFAVATGADVVSTLWNSLPFTPELRTEDLLEKVDKNALALFNEHQDAVRTASMIGGAFIPGGIAVKLLGRMRAGITAAGYTESGVASAVRGAFTGQRQKKLEMEIETIFAQSGAQSAEYKSISRQLYASNIGKELLDNAIIEVAVVGTMNAHPYMEDYLKDPLQNFAIGATVGGVLGTALAFPYTKRALMNLTAPIERKAAQDILDAGYNPILQRDMSLSESSAVQRHTANMKILDDLIINKDVNMLTKDVAERIRKAEGAQQAKAILRAAPWVEDVKDDVRLAVRDILNDSKFAGVDKIKWIDLSKPGKGKVVTADILSNKEIEDLIKVGTSTNQFSGISSLQKQNMLDRAKGAINQSFLTEDGKPAIAFVRLSTGETFAGDVRQVAHAVDIKNAKQIIDGSASGGNARVVATPNKDTFEKRLLRTQSAAQDDLEFLIELKRMSKLKDVDVPYVTIAPDDLARMNAMLSKFGSMTLEEQAKINIRFKSEYATYDQVVSYITQKVESGSLGVAPDYLAKFKNTFGPKSEQVRYGIFNKVSQKAQTEIDSWQGSPMSSTIEVDILKAFTGRGPGNAEVGKELYAAGKSFRDEIRKLANPDGFVYLWRAMQHASPVHRVVEGYSVYPLSGFGKPELYPIHVNSIVGMIGNPAQFGSEAEILVMSGRPKSIDPKQLGGSAIVPGGVVSQKTVFDGTPTALDFTQTQLAKVDVPTQSTESKITLPELYQKYADESTRQIQQLIGSKIMSFEEISARTNVQLDAVKAVAAGESLAEYPAQWRRYTDVNKIEDTYLHARDKLYAIMGNPEKNPNSTAMAKLDMRSYVVAQKDMFRQMTLQSNSRMGNDLLDLYGSQEMSLQLDAMQNTLAEIGNARVGDVRYQSADQALRELTKGPAITYTGKQLIDRVDAMKKKLLEPLAAAFTPFRGQPALFAEFNVVTNKLYSLKGWRDLRIDPDSGYGYIVQRQSVEGKMAEVPLRNADGTTYYVKQQEVLSALESTRSVSNEMLKAHNLVRHMTGQGPMNDLGFYLPPINLVGKSVAYVIDNTGKETIQLLVANKGDELESLIQAYKREHADEVAKGAIAINTKIEQEEWNLAKGYTDYQPYITYADNAAFHTGTSAQKIVPSDDRFVNNIMSGYENVIINSYRKYAETYLSDITGWLDKMSDYYGKNVEGQPKIGLFKEKVKDSAASVKNVLLGRDQLESSVGLKAVNSLTDLLYNRASSAVNGVAKSFQTEQVGSKAFFDELLNTLKGKGVDSPWKSFDEYLATTVAETRNIAPKIQSAGNGLLATLNLRMFEVAQAAVNIMSLPILTWSALMEKLPATNVNPQGNMIKFPLEIMYSGIKSMFGADAARLDAMWESQGLLKQVTRQYTEVTATLKGAQQSRQFMDKAVEAANSIQNNKWIKDVFSKPADFAEELTRKFAMHTGYRAAKQAYPGIDDTAATIAAVSFADRTIGNYHAAQRPALFQGTFGAAIGLYQTYVLTYAQSVYRSLENRNFKQLASLAIAQSGIFGVSSWPGYHTLSEQVVGHLSDQHVDLTTGTYRAVGDQAARLVLYGLPSSLGPAFYTRGDVSPRVPSTMSEIAVFNGIKQGWSAATQIIQKAGEGLQNRTFSESMLEALSLQSLNRPIARWAEMASGSSITNKFNTVTPTSEMFTPAGVFARMIGTRPVEEQVTRNAIYLNRYYEALDKERRDGAVDQLATAIRANKLDSNLVTKTAESYTRAGGNARGWQTALNQVMLQSTEGSRLEMMRHLEPTSPLNMMLRDLY